MAAVSVEEAVYNALAADAAFIASIGKLYWYEAPGGVDLPYVVYFQVDDPRTKGFLSYYGGQARLQFSVFDSDRSDGVAKAQAIVEKMQGLKGTYNGLRLTCEVANVVTQPSTIDNVFHRTVDVIVNYQEV